MRAASKPKTAMTGEQRRARFPAMAVRNVPPRNGSVALGRPMRRDSPAARIIAAAFTSAASLGQCPHMLAKILVEENRLGNTAPVPIRIAPHGDHFGSHRNS